VKGQRFELFRVLPLYHGPTVLRGGAKALESIEEQAGASRMKAGE
jgi:hypothetical protein